MAHAIQPLPIQNAATFFTRCITCCVYVTGWQSCCSTAANTEDSVKQIVMALVVVGLVSVAFLAASLAVYAESAVGLAVWPRVAYTHGYAQLRVQVERNEANRNLTWEVDGPNYYRSS